MMAEKDNKNKKQEEKVNPNYDAMITLIVQRDVQIEKLERKVAELESFRDEILGYIYQNEEQTAETERAEPIEKTTNQSNE